jgi:hypothetical protein
VTDGPPRRPGPPSRSATRCPRSSAGTAAGSRPGWRPRTRPRRCRRRGAPDAASIGNTLAVEFKSHGARGSRRRTPPASARWKAVAQGIFDARQKVVDAFDTLKELLKHPLGTLQEEARLAGELTGKLLARGLHSNDEGIRDFSRSTKQYALDQLTALAAKSGHIGAKASAAIENGLKSKNATIRKNSAGREARLPGRPAAVRRARREAEQGRRGRGRARDQEQEQPDPQGGAPHQGARDEAARGGQERRVQRRREHQQDSSRAA